MQICKHAHRSVTLTQCNCLVFITVAVSHNTGDQSAACTSFCKPCLPVRPACCHAVSGMASSVGSHIRPAAVGSVPVSHSRHTSQSFTDTQLDNVKTHSRADRLQRVFTVSAQTKDDFLKS